MLGTCSATKMCWEKHYVIDVFVMLYLLFTFSPFPSYSHLIFHQALHCFYASHLPKHIRKSTHDKQSFFGLICKKEIKETFFSLSPPLLLHSLLILKSASRALLFDSNLRLQTIVTMVWTAEEFRFGLLPLSFLDKYNQTLNKFAFCQSPFSQSFPK